MLALLLLLPFASARRHVPPPPRRRAPSPPSLPPLRSANASSFAATYSSPGAEALWPLPANVTLPPNGNPCTWGPVQPGFYVPGCASGGYPCDSYATLAEAQAACAADYNCGGVTSQDSGGPPWETRRGPKAVASAQGEQSYVISNDCHSDAGRCFVLPADFAVVLAPGSFSSPTLTAAMARATAAVGVYGATTTLPPRAGTLARLTVSVAASGGPLRLGADVDESYSLTINAAGAALAAPTVWGALRGLETVGQLARHSWTTDATGAINASYNELCAIAVADAPRFPIRSLMLDTSRHFMPVSVIMQTLELAAHLKMNAVRLHLIDDQSWSYYVPDLPVVSNTSAFSPLHVYSLDDLAALVAFGAARGIVVFPEIGATGKRRGHPARLAIPSRPPPRPDHPSASPRPARRLPRRFSEPFRRAAQLHPRDGLPHARPECVSPVHRSAVPAALAHDGQAASRAQFGVSARVSLPHGWG